jgi:dTDP-4-amino-4,6-dideoxygalactose transaminase
VSKSLPEVIPQTDPRAGYLAHQKEIDRAIGEVLARGRYILGDEVAAFEREFAEYIGVSHGIGVASGTDAIELALRACGIGPGDLVFTVSHTAVATVAAIELAGATPVLVDVDPQSYTMDVAALQAALDVARDGTPKAILPVHIYGNPADLNAIVRIARKNAMMLVEDCAQSHGATLDGKPCGTWGDIAAFSFYPTKNLGAFGDGGMIVTNNDALASKVRLLQQYGWRQRYVSEIAGLNSRLDEIQAAILRIKLRSLEADNKRRQEVAQMYNAAFADSGLCLPEVRGGVSHVYHQYVVQSSVRDAMQESLKSKGVGTLVHYPVPVHLQAAYAGRISCSPDMTNTEALAGRILSLPMYPELTNEQVRVVTKTVLAFLDQALPRAS